MIKVIDGKRYNTDTAEQVFWHSNGAMRNDFKFREKTLYRTKGNAWFIEHTGGPMSDMATRLGGGSIGWGEEIEPVSDDDAYGFLEAHSDDAAAMGAIDKYFADRVQDA